MKYYGRESSVHVKIKNKTAVIEFENNSSSAGHADVMKEIVNLIDNRFRKYVFDFKDVDISFNSSVSGFLVVTIKKIVESGAVVVVKNISESNRKLVKMVGLDDIDGGRGVILYKEATT